MYHRVRSLSKTQVISLLAFVGLACELRVLAVDPPISKEQLAKILEYPAEKISVRDQTAEVNRRSAAKGYPDIVSSHHFSGPSNTFAPVTVSVAPAKTFLTERMRQYAENIIKVAESGGSKPFVKWLSYGDLGTGLVGLGMGGPGGSEKRAILSLPKHGTDVQISIMIPGDPPLESMTGAESYRDLMTEGGVGQRLIVCLDAIASNAAGRPLRGAVTEATPKAESEVQVPPRRPEQAAEDPDWKQLQRLLGRPITHPQVLDFVKTHQLEKVAKGDSGLFPARHFSYSVHFEQDIVTTIQIKVSPWPKGYGEKDWTHYGKSLPGGLMPGDSRKAVERKLGSPTHPGNNHWTHHEWLTIRVLFNKDESAIQELYVSRTDDKP